jgi:lysophospholipase L1-like esterase
MSPSGNRIKRFLVSLLLAVLPILLLEGGLRLLEFGFGLLAAPTKQEQLIQGNRMWQHELFSRFRGVHESDPLLLWKFKPNVYQPLIRTNSHGLLGDEYPVAKPPGTYRILLLGDSTPVGLGLKQREHGFGEQLVEILNGRDDGRAYQLINAAVSGYTTQQGLMFLEHHGLQYEPDLVVTYFGNNDASMSGFISDRELVERNTRIAGFLEGVRGLATYRLLERLILPVTSAMRDRRAETREVVIRVEPDDYERNLERIIAITRENGIGLVMVDVPVPLEWPAGLQFKLFSDMTTRQGELVMSDQTQKLLNLKIAYALDWDEFARAHAQIPDYSIKVFQSAYEDQGDPGRARAGYEARLAEDPGDTVSLNNLGVLHCRAGDYPAAVEWFEQAVAVEPDYPVFHYNLGMALKGGGDLVGAGAALERARDLDYQSLRIKTPYREKLQALSSEHGIPLADAVSAFEEAGRERLFLDHCHPTRMGHWIIANEIAGLVPSSGMERAGSAGRFEENTGDDP